MHIIIKTVTWKKNHAYDAGSNIKGVDWKLAFNIKERKNIGCIFAQYKSQYYSSMFKYDKHARIKI